MKNNKIPFLLLAFLLLASLTACSLTFLNKTVTTAPDDKEPPAASQEPSVPSQTPDDAEPEPPAVEPAPAPLPDPDKGDGDISDTGEPDGEPEPDAPAAVAPSHEDVTLRAAGEAFKYVPKNVPGVYACTYTSDDPEIASVDETGKVTAVAPGATSISMHVECEEGQFDFKCIIRCNWKEEEPSAPDQPASGEADARPGLSAFFSSLQGSYEGLDAMMVMDSDLLENYYPGMNDISAVEEVLIQETMITTANVAVGLVKLRSDASLEDVIAVQDILQARIDAQAEGGAWYPASCETWKQGVITSVSNCVGMFVYPEDAQSMADAFVSAFSN